VIVSKFPADLEAAERIVGQGSQAREAVRAALQDMSATERLAARGLLLG
jgi:hypothetical protein